MLSADDEAAVRVLDGAGVFNAIQLGEWGYHYHRLRTDPNWMRDVLGKDFEAQRNRFLRPPETQGYEPIPKTRREAYDQLRRYFLWHRQAKGGRLISVTGHSHYECYAAEWGASVVGIEVGENIGFTQSKFAFSRGAARQWNLPWSVQMSPWFGNAVTTRGSLDTNGPTATGGCGAFAEPVPADVAARLVCWCGAGDAGEQHQLLLRDRQRSLGVDPARSGRHQRVRLHAGP